MRGDQNGAALGRFFKNVKEKLRGSDVYSNFRFFDYEQLISHHLMGGNYDAKSPQRAVRHFGGIEIGCGVFGLELLETQRQVPTDLFHMYVIEARNDFCHRFDDAIDVT